MINDNYRMKCYVIRIQNARGKKYWENNKKTLVILRTRHDIIHNT